MYVKDTGLRIRCKRCGKEFLSHKYFKQHVAIWHPDETVVPDIYYAFNEPEEQLIERFIEG